MGEKTKLSAKTPETKSENSCSQVKKTNFSKSNDSPISQLLFLQRTVGNRAVEGLLKSGVIQAKLTIGQPGDIYEQEADRVADQVMRMANPSTAGRKGVSEYNQVPSIQRVCTECEEELQRQTQNSELGYLELENSSEEQLHRKTGGIQVQRMCSECEEAFSDSVGAASSRGKSRQACPELNRRDGAPTLLPEANNYPNLILQRQPMEEEEELLQTKEISGETPEVTPSVETEINSIRGGGQPLPESVRAFFEPRFGQDFSQVRVHTDTKASESARTVNAKAYTLGRDIVFEQGHYAPDTGAGKKLIAHELAHTIQQSSGVHRVQRFVECLPITMAITKDDERCPKRVRGEIGRSRSSSMFLWELKNPSGWLVENFAIGSSSIKKNLESNHTWTAFKESMVKQTDKRWEILGFSDCSGKEGRNKTLRKERALAIFSILPESVQKRVDTAEDAFMGDCIVENRSEVGRSLNRSAFIRVSGLSFPSKEITVQPPKPKPKPTAESVDCRKSEVDQLSRAYPIAIDMAEKALDLMRGSSTPERKALLEKYFNDSGVSTTMHVRAGFLNLVRGIKSSFKFECEHEGEWFYDRFCDPTVAYVRTVAIRVHLCEGAFGKGDDRLARIIVHECSHMFDFTNWPGISDEPYCSPSKGCSKSLSRWDCIDNADSYAWFAFEAYKM